MIFSFIIKALIGLAGILLVCIALISKMNRTSGKEDIQQYDKDFNPYKPLSFYADDDIEPEYDKFDEKDLKFYKN